MLLKHLYLQGTGITDQGLRHLEQLKSLGELHLARTKVTLAGRKRLEAALQKRVIYD